jgi:hypothetical protein
VTPQSVDDWLDAFAAAVRTGLPANGRHLFLPTATGFGTVVTAYATADELEREQWSTVWPRTTGFEFDAVIGRWQLGDGEVIAALWHSIDSAGDRIRRGRATIVLRHVDGGLQAAHAHFSMVPTA